MKRRHPDEAESPRKPFSPSRPPHPPHPTHPTHPPRIKLIKQPTPPNHLHAQHLHSTLLDAILKIINQPNSPLPISLTTLANACQSLVLSDVSLCEDLYDNLELHLKIGAKGLQIHLLQPLLDQDFVWSCSIDRPYDPINLTSYEAWLSKLQSTWLNWTLQSSLIYYLLLPLNQCLSGVRENFVPISELTRALFRNQVIGQLGNPVCRSVSATILCQVTAYREGNQAVLKRLESLTRLVFETYDLEHIPILVCPTSLSEVSESFYRALGNSYASQIKSGSLQLAGPRGYLKIIQSRFELENALCRSAFKTPYNSFNRRILNSVHQAVGNNLFLAHLDVLLHYGFLALLDGNLHPEALEALSTFYKLIKMYGDKASQKLITTVSNWIKLLGSQIIEKMDGTTRQEKGVQDSSLIGVKSMLDYLVNCCFDKDPDLVSAIQLSFESLLTQTGSKIAKSLATDFDRIVCMGNANTITPIALEANFRQALFIFRVSPGKDIFSRWFQILLGHRLCAGFPAETRIEKKLLGIFSEECGRNFTHRWEAMVQDTDTSKKLTADYQAKRRGNATKKIKNKKNKKVSSSPVEEAVEINFLIVTAGMWPMSNKNQNIILPVKLKSQLDQFERFYTGLPNFSRRKLSWVHSKGRFLLQVNLPKSLSKQQQQSSSMTTTTTSENGYFSKDFLVHTFLGLVLLLFNDLGDQSIDFKSIVKKTGIEEKQVIEALRYLVYGTPNLLIRYDQFTNTLDPRLVDQTISPEDRFSFNSHVSFVNLIDQKDTPIQIELNQISDFHSEILLDEENHSIEGSRETDDEEPKEKTNILEKATLIEVTIVRIMKRYHYQNKNEKEEMTSLKFDQISDLVKKKLGDKIGIDQIDIKSLKSVIESLVDREYLKRVGLDQFTYLP